MLYNNKTIWKFRLRDGHQAETILNLPLNSKLLHVDWQNRSLYAWFEIEREQEQKEERKFYSMHTGGDFNDRCLQFIQTVLCTETYVLHIYEFDRKKINFLTDNDMRL